MNTPLLCRSDNLSTISRDVDAVATPCNDDNSWIDDSACSRTTAAMTPKSNGIGKDSDKAVFVHPRHSLDHVKYYSKKCDDERTETTAAPSFMDSCSTPPNEETSFGNSHKNNKNNHSYAINRGSSSDGYKKSTIARKHQVSTPPLLRPQLKQSNIDNASVTHPEEYGRRTLDEHLSSPQTKMSEESDTSMTTLTPFRTKRTTATIKRATSTTSTKAVVRGRRRDSLTSATSIKSKHSYSKYNHAAQHASAAVTVSATGYSQTTAPEQKNRVSIRDLVDIDVEHIAPNGDDMFSMFQWSPPYAGRRNKNARLLLGARLTGGRNVIVTTMRRRKNSSRSKSRKVSSSVASLPPIATASSVSPSSSRRSLLEW